MLHSRLESFPHLHVVVKISVTTGSCFLLFIEMAVTSRNAWYSDNTTELSISKIY